MPVNPCKGLPAFCKGGKMDIEKLISEAEKARKLSYSPYSNFMVGAAVLTDCGKIFTGCNIENAAYSPSNCAERTAIFKAVSEGITSFSAIAVVGGYNKVRDYCFPCGVCRQVLKEFCKNKDFAVIVAISKNEYKILTLDELLPFGFGPESII